MSKKQQEKQSIFPPTNVKSSVKKSKDCEDESKWNFCLSVAHVKPNDVGWGVYFEPGDAFSWG